MAGFDGVQVIGEQHGRHQACRRRFRVLPQVESWGRASIATLDEFARDPENRGLRFQRSFEREWSHFLDFRENQEDMVTFREIVIG